MKRHLLVIVIFTVINVKSVMSNDKNTPVMTNNLNKEGKQMAAIAASTAVGNITELRKSLNKGLDAGLTINQIKEILVQMYAYAGFPRSLTAINTFMLVLEERKSKGINDEEGRNASIIPNEEDKYERGRKVLEKLTGQVQTKPAKGFGEFSPSIDRFLKEHLFADVFDSDVLSYRERELATIAALASMDGVESMLRSHLYMGMNVGITEMELNDLFFVIEHIVGVKQADAARLTFSKFLENRIK